MKLVYPKGSTSRIVTVFIQANNVTTGAGLGSLTNASGIVGGYVREGGTGVALAVDEDVTTEGTYQAPSTAAHVRIGTPANMRSGTYELHFHNDLWATGAETVTITLGGAANMGDLPIEIQLSDPVRGLGAPSALPNAAADAAGGLPISDAGGLDLDAKLANTNEVTVARMGALTDWINGGRLDLILDIIAADTTTDIPATLVTIAAFIDTEVTDIQNRLPAALVGGRIDATVDGTGMEAAAVDAILDEVVAGTTTMRQLLRGFAATLLGKVSQADLNTPKFRDIADTKNVIDATTDADGNRTAVTLDLT